MGTFHFKYFKVEQLQSAQKVGTDSMVLGALVKTNAPKRILDIGAGTGVLSLMMAQKTIDSRILAVEIEENSFKECTSNFSNSPWSERLEVFKMDILDFNEEPFDLIISNPPYFEDSLKNNVESKVFARHTDSLPFERLIQKAASLLTESGFFWVILPVEGADKMLTISGNHKLYPVEVWEIEGKPNNTVRKVLAFSKEDHGSLKVNKLLVRNDQGDYSSEYKELTRDFHHKEL